MCGLFATAPPMPTAHLGCTGLADRPAVRPLADTATRGVRPQDDPSAGRAWRERGVRDGDRGPVESTGSAWAQSARPVPGLHAGRTVVNRSLMTGAAVGPLDPLSPPLPDGHVLPPVVRRVRHASSAATLAAVAVTVPRPSLAAAGLRPSLEITGSTYAGGDR